MKTTTKIRLFAITALMATIVAGTSLEVNGQQRDSRNGKKEERKESPSTRKFEDNKRNDHSRDDRSAREIRSHSDINRYGDTRQNDIYRRHENERRNYGNQEHKGNSSHSHWDKHKKPDHRKHYDTGKHAGHYHHYYHHPKYGKIYPRFYSNPFVFHHKHGRYYYYDGHFCDYRPGIGYIVVDIPYLTIFSELPFHCTRVRIHGNVYYRYGNLYFEALPIGYRLVPSPIQVHISARF
ncbi:MAG: hypothetical protein RBS73_02250 [Prolixibacteraceae bacterium]|jgi:hypothetical protein|nr:hypothetical protein [Prolixibacteraceae bacterium]